MCMSSQYVIVPIMYVVYSVYYTHELQIPEYVMAKCLFSNLLFRTGYDVKVNNLKFST